MKKKVATLFLAVILLCSLSFTASTAPVYAETNSSAQAAILMEKESGRILYAKNADAKLPMASCTKIVTAITVLQNCEAQEIVTIPKKAVGVEGSSIYLREGEQMTVLDLLYGLMLRSGNDAAVALALYVAGSVEDFSLLMNDTAQKIGAKNSNFTNPHGLHEENHYTTAYDLALITCHALKNPLFHKIVSTKKITIGQGEEARYFVNKNKLLSMFPYADGVKTGYTKRAGRCFVGSAQNPEGMSLVAVVLNCGPMFEEVLDLIQYGFQNYKLKNLVIQNKICAAELSKNKAVYYVCGKALYYPLKKDGSEDKLITKSVAKKGDDFDLSVYLDKQLIFSQKLVTIYDSVK